MVGCIPRYDQITGHPMRVTMDSDALTLVARKVGMTRQGYINANPTIIFEVWYDCYGIFIVYNELPSGHIKYLIK